MEEFNIIDDTYLTIVIKFFEIYLLFVALNKNEYIFHKYHNVEFQHIKISIINPTL